MNSDHHTSLPYTDVTKLLHLKSMAESIPDGFATCPRIIRNSLPGTGNTLPQKKPTSIPKTNKKDPKPKVMYTTNSTKFDPTSFNEAQSRSDWPKWQAVLEAEYASLHKHKVFGSTATDLAKPPIGHKLIFTRKLDARGNVIRPKVRLVAQGFS